MKLLSEELTQVFGRGDLMRNLELMRKFYLTYRSVIDEKTQTVPAFFVTENWKKRVRGITFIERKNASSV